ncbi:hypothetical protein Tco_0618818 [Tanacetum coccineum]
MQIDKRALHGSKWQMKVREVHTIKEIEKWLNESKMQTQEGMVNEGITLDAGLDSEESTYDNTSTEQQDGSSSSGYDANAQRAHVDKVVYEVEDTVVGPSYDNDTLTERLRSSLLCASCVFLLRREQKHILALEMPLSLSQMIQTIDLLSSFHVQWKTVGLPQCTQGGVKVLEWCEFCLVATVHVGGERDDE